MSAQKPVAIRITRPYQTEDEFFAAELETISRTGVTLVGAQQRPDGVVLRFELTLASGAPLIRGEGRVVGYKANAFGGEPGLSLRFTRLDSKSKSLVDRVGALRDVKRSIPPPPASAPKAEAAPAPPPPPTSSADAIIPILTQTAEMQISQAVLERADAMIAAQAQPTVARAVARPRDDDPDREAVLARLRSRSVEAAEIERILADGAARRRR